MIISASYRTDIPAFYSDWFINRLHAGFCQVQNPISKEINRVSLRREDVDAFVFWTKDIRPFATALQEVQRLGYPFAIQYAINNYPSELETFAADLEDITKSFCSISSQFGARSAVWRYDTIVLSSLTPREFHIKNFRLIGERLRGYTDEVVVSFAQIYQKTKRNMDLAAKRGSFSWEDPPDGVKKELLSELTTIATDLSFKLCVCSQHKYVIAGTHDARCIDSDRLSDVAGYRIHARKRGNRPDCSCDECRDIGAYDSCPHGCIYCYAVNDHEKAKRNYETHSPVGELLLPIDEKDSVVVSEEGIPENPIIQQVLF